MAGKKQRLGFQPKGPSWAERASTGDVLRAVLDPLDSVGRRNKFIDLVHKISLLSYKENLEDKLVLDFGCGAGRLTAWVSGHASHVVGIDVTDEMLTLALKHTPRAKTDFVHYDGLRLPFKHNCFDAALSVGVLQYFVGNNELNDVAKEIVRVLRRDGNLYLIEQTRTRSTTPLPSPRRYIDEFESLGCENLLAQPIRRGGHSLISLFPSSILSLFPLGMFTVLARLELLLANNAWTRGWMPPPFGDTQRPSYLESMFIFRKIQ